MLVVFTFFKPLFQPACVFFVFFDAFNGAMVKVMSVSHENPRNCSVIGTCRYNAYIHTVEFTRLLSSYGSTFLHDIRSKCTATVVVILYVLLLRGMNGYDSYVEYIAHVHDAGRLQHVISELPGATYSFF